MYIYEYSAPVTSVPGSGATATGQIGPAPRAKEEVELVSEREVEVLQPTPGTISPVSKGRGPKTKGAVAEVIDVEPVKEEIKKRR